MRSPCKLLIVVGLSLASLSRGSDLGLDFPHDFVLGAATSHSQVEGAWNVSDKSESMTDRFALDNRNQIPDGSIDDTTADSYHKYKEDVQLVKYIGLDAYRFSISWSRLLPNGDANYISADGLAYYKNLLEELITNGIKPIVTLDHMDHPQSLEDIGGWTNELMIDLFANYARVVFEELGSMVDTFITINEPQIHCQYRYHFDPNAHIPPERSSKKHGVYLCMHNVLRAHTKAWHIYNEEFRSRQHGKIGIVEACFSYQPQNASSPDDSLAVEYGFQFTCGWSMHPVYHGDYPEIMKSSMADSSWREGLAESRLPTFTDEEIRQIKGSSDYFGINYYHVMSVRFGDGNETAQNLLDHGLVEEKMSNKEAIAPGLRRLLRRVRDEYGNPPVLIAENGYCDSGGIEDLERIAYFHDVLTHVLVAMKEDGCNVVGYLVWSLIDTWEFMFGYTLKYGLYRVDFDSPDKTRTPRWSVSWWKKVMLNRRLEPTFTIDTKTNKTLATSSAGQRSSAASPSSMLIGFLAIILLSLQIGA